MFLAIGHLSPLTGRRASLRSHRQPPPGCTRPIAPEDRTMLPSLSLPSTGPNSGCWGNLFNHPRKMHKILQNNFRDLET